MNIETRLTNLENLVDSLINMMNNKQFYTDADIAGCRHTEGDLSNKNTKQDGDIEGLGDAIIEMSEIIYH